MERRLALVVIGAVLVVSSCSGGGIPVAPATSPPTTAAEPTSSATEATSAPEPTDETVVQFAASIEFAEETDAVSETTVTFQNGGKLEATAADGTIFSLEVPGHAVADDTTITMTPLTSVEGVGGPVHAVKLEPDGLEFAGLARLTITPGTPIAVENQVMFQATSDGDEVLAALVDASSEPIAILLPHFTVPGAAYVAGRVEWLYFESAQALQKLGHQAATTLQEERKRQLAGQPERPEVWDEVIALFEQANRDVLEPLKEAALLDCDGATEYIKALRNIEATASTVGLSADQFSSAVQNEMAAALDSSFVLCEREAIERCQKSRDAAELFVFWVLWDRQLILADLEAKIIQPDSEDRARRICVRALQFELFGDARVPKTGYQQTIPIRWHYWGLLCPESHTWQVWEEFDGVQGHVDVPPDQEVQPPILMTFDRTGALTSSLWAPLGAIPGTLQGTGLALSPGDPPTEVTATINEGDGQPITVRSPIEPYDGSFGECIEET